MSHATSTDRGQRGTSMIEALIAVLVLSLSALGYANLQVQGLSRNSSALWRSKATQMAYEMADRMRANQGGVMAGSYNSLTSTITAPSCGAIATPCTPTSMALLDFVQWRTDVANALPGGIGVVCITSTPNSGSSASPACDGVGTLFAVKVFWTEKGSESLFATVLRP